MSQRYLDPPVSTYLVRDVVSGTSVIRAGTPVAIYYGDPELGLMSHYAVRAGEGRTASVHGSALALLAERSGRPRVVSV